MIQIGNNVERAVKQKKAREHLFTAVIPSFVCFFKRLYTDGRENAARPKETKGLYK